jgi:succinate dehydrogenase / fumarate reductase cytochrome b subunit
LRDSDTLLYWRFYASLPLHRFDDDARRKDELENATASSFIGRHQFLIYRLFSLAGIVPIGGYLVFHLGTNALVLISPASFQAAVDQIHSLGFLVPVLEWTFIFGPMLFHAAVGWLIISGMVANVGSYPYTSNVRYTLQRVTGMIAFFFILWHLWHMHQYGKPFGGGWFDAHHASSSASAALQSTAVRIGYVIGVLAAVYHLANGIWTFGITWGIWTSERAMRGASYVCLAFGILLAGTGIGALVGMTQVDVDEARLIEDRREQQRRWERGDSADEIQEQAENGLMSVSRTHALNPEP